MPCILGERSPRTVSVNLLKYEGIPIDLLVSFVSLLKAEMTEWLKNNPGAVIGELVRILPDALVIMPGFFSILTTSYPQFIFFLSLLEAVGIFYILRSLGYAGYSKNAYSSVCKTGFDSASFSSISMFKIDKSSFPSAPIFITSTAASYLFNSISSQLPTLEMLGPVYVLRFYTAIISMCILLFFLGAYRLQYECDSFFVVLSSIALGLVVGTMLILQNNAMLGPDGINLVGIPILKDKTVTGEQIYICTQGIGN